MDKAVDFFRDQLRGIRYGEISPALLDTIRVEAYEQRLPLKQIAWTSPDKNNRILVSPYDTALLGAYVFSKTQVVVNCPVRSGEDRERVIQHYLLHLPRPLDCGVEFPKLDKLVRFQYGVLRKDRP